MHRSELVEAPLPPLTIANVKAATELLQHDARLVRVVVNNGRQIAPSMARVLREQGVPEDLLAVVFVESRFERGQRSYRGAGGLWQFMPATARSLGLDVSLLRDQRKDPILSTKAAARYLKRHYEDFGTFELALAAYNAGAGRVRKALRTHGVTTFEELAARRALPSQTLNYVPKVLAARMVVRRLNYLNWQVEEDQWDFVLGRVSTFIALAGKDPALLAG
jgi:membrane-bound lytic murein transglycosylase D